MENTTNEKEMEILYNRFMKSFVESRDPRIDLEINALKQLKGPYLEKAKVAILESLEKGPGSDAILSARAINLVEAIPFMAKWLHEIRLDPTSKYRYPYHRGQLAYNLYEFTKDESYIPDLIYVVENEGYGEFTIGVSCLSQMPLTHEGISAVWNKYKKGKTIKEPDSWREGCAWFLREKIKELVGQSFLSSLPGEEQKELLELIGESSHQRLERKFRLERYIYGRERYKKEDVNRFDEYTRISGTPVKGMTLKQLWKGHLGGIHTLTWSTDGRYLASTPSSALIADSIRIWSLESGQGVKELEPVKKDRYDKYEPKRITWILNKEKQLAVAYDYSASSRRGNRVSLWDVEAEKLIPSIFEADEKNYLNDLLSFPDGETLLLNVSNTLFMVNIVTQTKERILETYSGRFEAISISPNGKVVAIGYYELKDPKTGIEYQLGLSGEGAPHEVLFYDVAGKKVTHRLNTGHLKGLNKLCWMPGDLILAIASSDNTISVWDFQRNKRMVLLESKGLVGSISGLDFSSNGALLASKSDGDELIRIWRTDKWEEVVAFRELNSYASFSFHPSLPIFASICSLREANDNSSEDSPAAIRVWEFDYEAFLSNPPFMEEFEHREAEIRTKLLRKEITEDLEYIKIGGSPAMGLKLHRILSGHTGRIHKVSWSPDGNYLASPADDKTVRIWDEATGECISTLEEQEELKHSDWSPNGEHLVYGGNKQIKLWDIKTRASVDLLQRDFLRLDSLVFSPDGKKLALAYGYNTVQILDTSTWQEINRQVFDQRSNPRIKLQWSDNSHILVNPRIGIVQLLSVETLRPVNEIVVPGNHDEMYGFSFLYANFKNKVVITEEKKPMAIYDLENGQFEMEVSDATSYVSGLSFSSDGRILISWCQDSSVYFWRSDTGQKLARIHEYSLRIVEPVYPSFHPLKPSLVTFCDKRRSMRIWDIDYKELLG